MAIQEVKIFGLKEFQRAIQRNPEAVKTEIAKFFVRAKAVYLGIIKNNPWRVGAKGGGSPVRTGFLRDTHKSDIQTWQLAIFPIAKYAKFVHKGRPWLDYAKKQGAGDVSKLEEETLKGIVKDLAK